jgi:sigma-B regulation protein RsbU (phosphoserine phosphatase)
MASVHASLRALAGTDTLERMIERLNRFLFASTQANKYVTLFYAELAPDERRLRYVNAGHVPPYLIGREGCARLTMGGPALGLLDDVAFEMGEVAMEPGDVVAMVTDGATEAVSPEDVEFGDERVVGSLRRAPGGAAELLQRLVDDIHLWAAAAGCSDDLTAMVLRAL